jgi:hypothetical protein
MGCPYKLGKSNKVSLHQRADQDGKEEGILMSGQAKLSKATS